ncbi:hypothetical protein A8F88_01490 [Escherichia coli]|nr:hypothetical protein A8F88_01490 [Escherichia coli]
MLRLSCARDMSILRLPSSPDNKVACTIHFFAKKVQGLRICLLAAAGSVAGTTFYEKNLISKIYADKANRMNKMDKR